jgi:glycosyltransferase involved in cell wall biosynthesis
MWFEALTTEFVPDLLHIYGFSATVRFNRKHKIPVVLGQGTGGALDITFYHGWNRTRIRLARWRKMMFLKCIGAYDSSQNPRDARAIHVWSEFSKTLHLAEGQLRPAQIEVLSPGLPRHDHTAQLRARSDDITFLFVGRDFERKNGPLMLEAFRRVRARHSQARLILIGIPPKGEIVAEEGIAHYSFIPRQELYERIYPQADVLILPSKAEGYGLVLLEAMSFGMPVIGVNAWAMPEIITDGENGFLIAPDSVDELAARMCWLIEQPSLMTHIRQRAREVFSSKFSIEQHNRKLRAIYDQVLNLTGKKPVEATE